jgi:hypothetical protein
VLPAQAVEGYLQGVPDFVINPPPKRFTISRNDMWKKYGGQTQRLIAKISPERNPSSTPDNPITRKVLYPQPDTNPSAPKRPGCPGLLFASRPEVLKNDTHWTLFGKIPADSALWQYLGEYHNTLVGSISGEQFCAQKPEVICWCCLPEIIFIMIL